MIGGDDDAEELAGAGLIAAGDGLTVEVLVRRELAERVVSHRLALTLREDAGDAAAHVVVFVGGDAVEGIGLGDL